MYILHVIVLFTLQKPIPKGRSLQNPGGTVGAQTADDNSASSPLVKKPSRPSTLPYNNPTNNPTNKHMVAHGSRLPSESSQMSVRSAEEFDAIQAPKATPEDITTYSSTSSSETNMDSMQCKMLNVFSGGGIDEQIHQCHSPSESLVGELRPAIVGKRDGNRPFTDLTGEQPLKLHDSRPRDLLLRQLTASDSEHYESDCSHASHGSLCGAVAVATRLVVDSGYPSDTATSKDSQVFNSNTCLLVDDDGGGGACAPDPGGGGSSSDGLDACDYHVCEASPGMACSRFCHTGAHALDIFVSPDEVPYRSTWTRPLKTSSSTRASALSSPEETRREPTSTWSAVPSYHLPKVGARTPMQTPAASLYSDDDDDLVADDSDLLYSHKQPLLATSPLSSPNRSLLPRSASHPNPKRVHVRTKPHRHKHFSSQGVFTQVPGNTMR